MNHSEIINEYRSGFGCVCEDTVIGCRKKRPILKQQLQERLWQEKKI
jgi:broad-specificity NMP kinase